jgi:hypothetical protein
VARIPLVITGEAVGPRAQFNFDLLDIGEVFVFSHHTYAMVLSNTGNITA